MRPRLNVLSADLIARVLDDAMHILSEFGIDVRGAELRQHLLAHGLPLDVAGERVLFPREVVEQAIADAPGSFVLYDRDGRPHVDLGGDRVHFVPGSSGLAVLDHRTGETRPARTRDAVEYVRLADGLANIPCLATAFSTDDVEPQVADAWRLYICLTGSRKPVVSGAFTEDGVKRMVEMQQLFRRDRAELLARPMCVFTITASGSFRFGEESCQNLVDCVEAGIPVEIVPVTLMGLVAPVTTVGATVFHTVDVLAGLTMTQLVRPGAPVLFGGAPATFHMRHATSPMTAIEALELSLAYVAVAKSLGLPSQAYMALSDSKVLDAQAGAESFGGALLAALAGINSVSGAGMLDFVLVFSLAKLVLDAELCGQALHLVREIRVLDDLPVTGLVEQLIADQHLITSDHTLAHWPEELYLPGPVIDRESREGWEERGASDAADRASAEVDRLLSAYEPVEVDPAVDQELLAIVRSGLRSQERLPAVPAVEQPLAGLHTARRRGRRSGGPGR